MASVYISLGSNIEPELYLQRGIDELDNVLTSLALSTVYRSVAKGFDGPDFLNAVCRGETAHSPQQLAAQLKVIEDDCDRDRSADRFSSRTLDLDLLLYDEQIIEQPGLQIPRAEILEEAFVLQPLVDLAGPQLHPVTGLSLAEHRQQLVALKPADFSRLQALPAALFSVSSTATCHHQQR